MEVSDRVSEQPTGSLGQANSETEHLLASIAWILIAVDERGAVTRWNAAAETAFAIPAAAVLGRPLRETGIAWDWRAMLDRIALARASDTPSRFDDVAYRRADGGEGYLGITLATIRAGRGQPAGILLLGADTTERRLLEAQLAQAQKLESIGQLAAGVAHELNTPIQFIGDNVRFMQGAFAELSDLLESYRALRAAAEGHVDASLVDAVTRREAAADIEYLTAEIPSAIDQTLDGIGRVATIVRALKEFAHPDQKDMTATDLNQAVLCTLTVARNEVKYVADVETELGDLPLVVCHPGELNQVILNLVVNAAQAIADVVAGNGGRGLIRVKTSRDDDAVVIAISDTGGGIPAAAQPRIFDPFFTTKAVGRGTGQGLSIARNVVVDKHGGTLTFETEIGRGSTFFVRLPLGECADPVQAAP